MSSSNRYFVSCQKMPSRSLGYLYSNKQSNGVVYIFVENINIREKAY